MNYRTLADGIEFVSTELLKTWRRRYSNMLANFRNFPQRSDIEWLLKQIQNELNNRNIAA